MYCSTGMLCTDCGEKYTAPSAVFISEKVLIAEAAAVREEAKATEE